MVKKEPSFTAGGNVNRYGHYGKQYRIPSKIRNRITSPGWCVLGD